MDTLRESTTPRSNPSINGFSNLKNYRISSTTSFMDWVLVCWKSRLQMLTSHLSLVNLSFWHPLQTSVQRQSKHLKKNFWQQFKTQIKKSTCHWMLVKRSATSIWAMGLRGRLLSEKCLPPRDHSCTPWNQTARKIISPCYGTKMRPRQWTVLKIESQLHFWRVPKKECKTT